MLIISLSVFDDGDFSFKRWFSPALGAFIIPIIAETTQAEQIEH
jgi:hypothetical protein